MLAFMTIARALTDENRVRILMALDRREMCVCQVTAFLDLSPSTTSKHLSILKQARLIESRKKGKWVYYRLAESKGAPRVVCDALQWVREGVGSSGTIFADETRIKAILEEEKRLNNGQYVDPDTFHSLEIHTLSYDDEQLEDAPESAS